MGTRIVSALLAVLILSGCGKKDSAGTEQTQAPAEPAEAAGGELNPAPKPSASFVAAPTVPATVEQAVGWWKSEKLGDLFYDLQLFHLEQVDLVMLTSSKNQAYRPDAIWEIGGDGNIHFAQRLLPNVPKDGMQGTAKLQEDGTLRVFITYLPYGDAKQDWVVIDGVFTLKSRSL